MNKDKAIYFFSFSNRMLSKVLLYSNSTDIFLKNNDNGEETIDSQSEDAASPY